MKEDMRLTLGHNSSANLLAQQMHSAHRHNDMSYSGDPHEDFRDNESCDISPDHDGSTGRRQLAPNDRHSGKQVMNGGHTARDFFEETDVSQLNPLATDREATTNRCSLFEEQTSGRKKERRVVCETSGNGGAALLEV